MAELSARFEARAREERMTIAALVVRQDRITVSEHAHRLAGAAGLFGHPRITEAALTLEAAAEEGRVMDQAAKQLLDLLAEIETD